MIPLKINGKHLYAIFEPSTFSPSWSDATVIQKSLEKQMFPTEVYLTSETYSRDAERTADYELEDLNIVNRKAKPEVTWSLIKADYVKNLLLFLNYKYDFKVSGEIVPEAAPTISITYMDFIGSRTINTYLGQTIEGTMVEYDGVLYWENFRIAFPER